jgi:uncharacterized LabA/DUF88 family protein
MNKKKVAVFVDGFNLYHAIDAKASLRKYKWLNLKKLAACFLKSDEQINEVYYFTALVPWDNVKKARHELYIKALENEGVKTVYGAFRRVEKKCRECGKHFPTYEEKQTDVNIAIQLFKSAVQNQYDRAIIISGDSDLIPAITAVPKALGKGIRIIIPIGRRAEELKMSADGYHKLKERHLSSCQLEDKVVLQNGAKIMKPDEWN